MGAHVGHHGRPCGNHQHGVGLQRGHGLGGLPGILTAAVDGVRAHQGRALGSDGLLGQWQGELAEVVVFVGDADARALDRYQVAYHLGQFVCVAGIGGEQPGVACGAQRRAAGVDGDQRCLGLRQVGQQRQYLRGAGLAEKGHHAFVFNQFVGVFQRALGREAVVQRDQPHLAPSHTTASVEVGDGGVLPCVNGGQERRHRAGQRG